MQNNLPEWQEFSNRLIMDLRYSKATMKRYKNTFQSLENVYLIKTNTSNSVMQQLEECIQLISNDYELRIISRDKLLRLRRVISKISDYIQNGSLIWKRLPIYEKRYAINKNEIILKQFLQYDNAVHAESIVNRSKGIIRQFLIYLEDYQNRNLKELNDDSLLSFLRYMNQKRSAGLKTVISSLKGFLKYLYKQDIVSKDFSYVLKNSASQHHKVYGIFSHEEKELILKVIENNSAIGKRDYAIFSLVTNCGLRSSDIASLQLTDIDWHNSCISIIQRKTRKQLVIPFKTTTGDALVDYILHGRGHSKLPYVFLKDTYCDTKMSSSLLCQRLEKYMKLAKIKRLPTEKINMHTFRRSLGTELIESGSNLEIVSQILGHEGTSATQIYISYSEESLSKCPLDLTDLPELWKEDGHAF